MKKIQSLITILFFSSSLIAQQKNNQSIEKIISIKSGTIKIEGNLLAVSNKQKIVILFAGSGPTDRNGNNPFGVNCDSYKMLAQELLKNNIASFRFDKRGVAKSSYKNFKESELIFDDYINDAETIFKYFRDSLRYKNIYLAGHSEGSLIAMIASENVKTKGYISIAGAGRSIDKIIDEQIIAQSPIIAKQADSLFNILKTKGKIDSLPPYLLSILRPSIQPYMISWMKYKPEIEISKLHIPILILQGTCDVQVKEFDATNLLNGNKKATLSIIKGMTHTLKNADENCIDKNQQTYHNPKLPLNKEFVSELVKFVKKN